MSYGFNNLEKRKDLFNERYMDFGDYNHRLFAKSEPKEQVPRGVDVDFVAFL